jgi:hypothetical protein
VTIKFLGFTLVRINININENSHRKCSKNNVETPLNRFRTTITGKPVDWKKRKKFCQLNVGQVHDAKQPFDDTMSELRVI